jgi:PAS domain S-box-containing protein
MKPPKEKSPPATAAQRFELLVRAVTDYAIFMLDPGGIIVSWNAGAQQLKGYSEPEILGQHFSIFFTEPDRAAGKPERALETARKTGRFEDEGVRVRKDGSRFWALAVIDTIRDERGNLVGFAKITRDMTSRRQAEQALRESERQFRMLVAGVRDYAIYMLDPEGNIASWNAGATLIKGYSAEEVVGSHFSRFFTDEDRAAGLPQKALAAAVKTGKLEAEGWRVRKDGTRFWAMVVIDTIHDERGHLVGFAKITRDITERRNADEHLKQTREQLFQAQKMEAVGQLTGGVAHDFNNLLTIILGNLEIARDNLESGREGAAMRALRAVNNGARGAQRAATLTQRLLSFSRRQALEPKAIDANKVVTGAADFLQQSLGENISVEMVRASGLWRVEADPTHLETAIFNVALNARDAMADGGRLTIETANAYLDEGYCAGQADLKPGQYVQIAITDTGHGMTKEVVERAFEPFFTTKIVGQGTGLGLSQVYGFVKQSGGHVRIESKPGEGTTVKLYLPRMLEEGAAETEVSEKAVGGVGETILVVEDDQDVRDYVVELVRTLNYHVLAAADADAALVLLDKRAEKVDLLLTDVVLPGINGRQLAEQAHARCPDLKILFMTGYSRDAIIHHGRLDPGVELIQKPFTKDAIALRIRGLLDREEQA